MIAQLPANRLLPVAHTPTPTHNKNFASAISFSRSIGDKENEAGEGGVNLIRKGVFAIADTRDTRAQCKIHRYYFIEALLVQSIGRKTMA